MRLADASRLIEFHLDGRRVSILRILNEETIRNVTIIVPVLITSCQVIGQLEVWTGDRPRHYGPSASARTQARSISREVTFAISAKSLFGVRIFMDGGIRIGVWEMPEGKPDAAPYAEPNNAILVLVPFPAGEIR
jgi:hypothetical protein